MEGAPRPPEVAEGGPRGGAPAPPADAAGAGIVLSVMPSPCALLRNGLSIHGGGQPPGGALAWVEQLLGPDVSRAVGAVACAVGRDCNKDLYDAMSGAIRDSVLSPVLDRLLRDLMPYLWCLGGLLAGLAIVCTAQLAFTLLLLHRAPR